MDKTMKKRAINSLYCLEFNLQKKSIIWWFAVLAVLLIIEIAFYPLMNMMIGVIPDDVYNDFTDAGISFSFDSVTEYFLLQGVEVLALGGALFLCCFVASLLTRDFKGGQSELLYTNALNRNDIIMTKYANAVTMTVLFNVVMLVVELLMMCIVDIKGIVFVPLITLFLYCLILHLILVSLVFGIYLLKVKSGFGIAIAIPLLLYFVTIIALSISHNDALKFIEFLTPFTPLYEITIESPFKVNWYSFAIYVVVVLAVLGFGYKKFKKRDL